MRAEKKEPAIEDLLRAWGLMRVPFAPDEKDTFPARSHQELLPLLDTTAALRGVMVLTGSPGTGKSTLLKSWLRGLDPKRHLPALITQSSLSDTGVLEILLSKLGERPHFKRSANFLTLEKHLADIGPPTLMLILDDAQNYPAPALEEIRMLLGLGGRQRSAFALILLGDDYLLGSLRLSVQRALFSAGSLPATHSTCPTIRLSRSRGTGVLRFTSVASRPHIRLALPYDCPALAGLVFSRVSAAHQLLPLPREEIAPCINWHISRAGLDREIFAPAAVDLLAEASEANPRTLNLLAQAAWSMGSSMGSVLWTIGIKQFPAPLNFPIGFHPLSHIPKTVA